MMTTGAQRPETQGRRGGQPTGAAAHSPAPGKTAGLDRDIVAQAVIIIAACIGGWMALVQPRAAELESIERVIELHSMSDDGLDRSMIERAAHRMGEIRQRLGTIEAANDIARDSSRLYATLTELARTHGVQVQNLQPGAALEVGGRKPHTGRSASSDAGRASNGATNAPSVRQVGITIEGTYERIAQFLIAIDEMAGFIRPSTLMLLPRDGEEDMLVVAQLTCDVLSFDVPEPLTALRGGIDGAR